MALLEELTAGVWVEGLIPGSIVTIISAKQHGSVGVELIYKDASVHLESDSLYQDDVLFPRGRRPVLRGRGKGEVRSCNHHVY